MSTIRTWGYRFLLTIFFTVTLPAVVMADVYRLAVTDLEGMEQLQREFGAFRDLLEQKSGVKLKFYPVPNRTAAVEAMRSKRVDFVLTGPAEYVVFQTKTQAKPVIGFSRPDYFADLIVRADSGITNIAQLKGKKVAMGAIGSTSKHLTPMQLIKDAGLDPREDIKVIHTSVKLGWEALKRGDVAAFATTNNKFLKLRNKDKQMQAGAFRVIARSRDLPNDLLLVRPGIKDKIVKRIRKAFINNEQALAQAILQGEDNKKYKGMTFLPNIKDSDYNYVRSMYVTTGYPQFARFVGE